MFGSQWDGIPWLAVLGIAQYWIMIAVAFIIIRMTED